MSVTDHITTKVQNVKIRWWIHPGWRGIYHEVIGVQYNCNNKTGRRDMFVGGVMESIRTNSIVLKRLESGKIPQEYPSMFAEQVLLAEQLAKKKWPTSTVSSTVSSAIASSADTGITLSGVRLSGADTKTPPTKTKTPFKWDAKEWELICPQIDPECDPLDTTVMLPVTRHGLTPIEVFIVMTKNGSAKERKLPPTPEEQRILWPETFENLTSAKKKDKDGKKKEDKKNFAPDDKDVLGAFDFNIEYLIEAENKRPPKVPLPHRRSPQQKKQDESDSDDHDEWDD